MRRHLLCDLEPGRSYRVLRDGARFEEFRASEAGTGRFISDRGGEFRLLPGSMSPDS